MKILKQLILTFIYLVLVGCNSNPPAPVIDRAPSNQNPKISNHKKTSIPQVETPSTYTVKKGDTLFAIGLEYGYDYKEIAAANNIQAPYAIQIGQKLVFPSTSDNSTPIEETKTGVVVTPIKTEPVTSVPVKPMATPPVLSEPKAIREPYSLEAMNKINNKVAIVKPAPIPAKIETTPPPTKEAETISTPNKSVNNANTNEGIGWSWPTTGKVVSTFKEASNKGIDIAGNEGQIIQAAANGKVIYTGSDLRGYGKLVIIKHDKNFLSVYAHNSKILVKEGQWVGAGQKIAEMGNTDSNTVKLHFEIREKGKSVDPMQYLSQNQ